MRKRSRLFLILSLAISIGISIPALTFGEEKLIVKDSEDSTTFSLEDDGTVFTSSIYTVQALCASFWLDELGSDRKGAYFVLDENWMQVQRRSQNFGAYEASPVFINIDAPHSAFVIGDTGNVGFGKWGPTYPLHMASGAYVSSGGVWTNASSREYKTDIKKLTAEKAMATLTELNPVEFAYKTDLQEKYVGFIAEDAPELVATKDRKGMSPMDVVAVLTKVVQEQNATIAELSRRLALVEKEIKTK